MATEVVRIGAHTIHVDYEHGEKGLWYASSEELPGLFVAGPTLDDCRREAWHAARRLLLWNFTVST